MVLASKNMMVMMGLVIRGQLGLAAPQGTEVVWAPQWNVGGQGLATRACPTAHPESRAAGGHCGSPDPGHPRSTRPPAQSLSGQNPSLVGGAPESAAAPDG